MNILEPETSRPISFWGTFNDRRSLYVYSYSHSIVRWKRLLVHLFPSLQYILALIERLYISVCWRMFEYCDRAHKSASKEEAVIIVTIIFHEIKNPTEIETLDPSVLRHLQLLLQTRLKVFCSRIFDFDESEKVNVLPDSTSLYLAMMVNRVPELSSYIPPRYCAFLPLLKPVTLNLITIHNPAKPVDLPACRLRRSVISQRCDESVEVDGYCCDESVEVDGYCCGWTYQSIPASFVRSFAYSAREFVRYHQSQSQETGLGKDDVPFYCRYTLNLISKEAWKEDFSVRKKMLVFGEALSVGIYHLLRSIEPLRPVTDIITRTKFLQDQFDRLAKDVHPHLFTLLLQSVATMSDYLWMSGPGSEVDPESTDELSLRLHAWASERWTVVDRLGFRSIINMNLWRTIRMVLRESDDDMSSGDNSDSFEWFAQRGASEIQSLTQGLLV